MDIPGKMVKYCLGIHQVILLLITAQLQQNAPPPIVNITNFSLLNDIPVQPSANGILYNTN